MLTYIFGWVYDAPSIEINMEKHMKKTLVCNLLHSIQDLLEQSDPKELEKAGIGKKLLYISDDLMNTFLIDNHNAPSGLVHKDSTVPKSDPIENDDIEITEDVTEKSFEELLEDAYAILRTETRLGPTLVHRQLGIPKSKAAKLLKELIDTGRLVKGQRAADIDGYDASNPLDTTKDELADGFAPVEDDDTPKSLEQLIGDLPIGDNLLVLDHLKPLIVLPEANRAIYLSGLVLKDVVSAEAIEEAVLDGVDRTLIDQIIDGANVKAKPVADRLNLGNKNDETMVRYARLRGVYVKGIPNGRALYDVMTVNGINKRVLSDLKKIYESGDL